MGSRGIQRQFRRARSEIRRVRAAYFAANPPPFIPAHRPDSAFPGLDGLMVPRFWRPYPFGDGWAFGGLTTGSIRGRARTLPDATVDRLLIEAKDRYRGCLDRLFHG